MLCVCVSVGGVGCGCSATKGITVPKEVAPPSLGLGVGPPAPAPPPALQVARGAGDMVLVWATLSVSGTRRGLASHTGACTRCTVSAFGCRSCTRHTHQPHAHTRNPHQELPPHATNSKSQRSCGEGCATAKRTLGTRLGQALRGRAGEKRTQGMFDPPRTTEAHGPSLWSPPTLQVIEANGDYACQPWPLGHAGNGTSPA
jgi:hypothetical protein